MANVIFLWFHHGGTRKKTIHGHFGWVPMPPDLSDQLEEAYTCQPTSVVRYPDHEDPDIVWKIDLGKKTQRRSLNGKDNCTRRIRRIYWEVDLNA